MYRGILPHAFPLEESTEGSKKDTASGGSKEESGTSIGIAPPTRPDSTHEVTIMPADPEKLRVKRLLTPPSKPPQPSTAPPRPPEPQGAVQGHVELPLEPYRPGEVFDTSEASMQRLIDLQRAGFMDDAVPSRRERSRPVRPTESPTTTASEPTGLRDFG